MGTQTDTLKRTTPRPGDITGGLRSERACEELGPWNKRVRGGGELPLQKMENHRSAPLPQSLLGNVITMITDMDSDGKGASQGRPPQPDSTITSSSPELTRQTVPSLAMQEMFLCFLPRP